MPIFASCLSYIHLLLTASHTLHNISAQASTHARVVLMTASACSLAGDRCVVLALGGCASSVRGPGQMNKASMQSAGCAGWGRVT